MRAFTASGKIIKLFMLAKASTCSGVSHSIMSASKRAVSENTAFWQRFRGKGME